MNLKLRNLYDRGDKYIFQGNGQLVYTIVDLSQHHYYLLACPSLKGRRCHRVVNRTAYRIPV